MPADREPAFYRWRQMTPAERAATWAERRLHRRPWHSPPHYDSESGLYLVTAACYEHRPHIGHSAARMAEFSAQLLESCDEQQEQVCAWVVLPNHYHLLLRSPGARPTIQTLGRVHGRTSFRWNREEACRGRKVWHNALETGIRSERHFWATLLYVLNNPVRHGYVNRWQQWKFGSAKEWLDTVGRDKALRLWNEFPIDNYGTGWDPPEL